MDNQKLNNTHEHVPAAKLTSNNLSLADSAHSINISNILQVLYLCKFSNRFFFLLNICWNQYCFITPTPFFFLFAFFPITRGWRLPLVILYQAKEKKNEKKWIKSIDTHLNLRFAFNNVVFLFQKFLSMMRRWYIIQTGLLQVDLDNITKEVPENPTIFFTFKYYIINLKQNIQI